jgi:DNA-binding HxlR family transcriptional regulator
MSESIQGTRGFNGAIGLHDRHPDQTGKRDSKGSEAVSAVGAAPQGTDATEVHRVLREDLDLIACADRTLEVLHGKWKVHLLFVMARGIHRHSRLLDCLPGVSKKVMTESLRALERDGLVARTIYAEVPVRVEYSLTPLGWSLTEPLIALAEWGSTHAEAVADARAHYSLKDAENGQAGLAA